LGILLAQSRAMSPRCAMASVSMVEASVTTSACRPSMTARACALDPPWDCLMVTATPFSLRYWAVKEALRSRHSSRVGS
jgi:hypothetical protein